MAIVLFAVVIFLGGVIIGLILVVKKQQLELQRLRMKLKDRVIDGDRILRESQIEDFSNE